MKRLTIAMVFIALLGAAVFWEDVSALFAGMSPLEALERIVTFVLHVAVATLAMYAVTTIPHVVKPWLRTFRWKQRAARRGAGAIHTARLSSPKVNKDALLMAFLEREMSRKGGRNG